MPPAKQKAEKQAAKAQAEAEKVANAELEQGYVGDKVDPRPNSDYSLESGPDSPGAVEAAAGFHRDAAEELEAAAE